MPPDLVATLGPASADDADLHALVRGATRLRLNASHLNAAELRTWLRHIERARTSLQRPVPVVIDLQGAKMRLGALPHLSGLPETVWLREGGEIFDDGALPVPHPELFDAVEVGETLSLNDDRVRLRVEAVDRDEAGRRRLRAQVTRNGPLSARKGINRPDHPLPFEGLTAADEAALEVGRDFERVQFAFSFSHTGAEAAHLRARTEAPLIAKIERPEAFTHLKAIDASFDELWLCRGDLGAQAGLARLGALQRRFTELLPTFRHPALLAGQVLEHLSQHPEPTRSEVVHLYDILAGGYAGIVLSDETAIGSDPQRAVYVAGSLLRGEAF